MGSQRVRHDLVTNTSLQTTWTEKYLFHLSTYLQMEKLSPRKSRSHEGFLALNSIMKANIFRNQRFGGLKAFKSEMNELG